MSNKKYNQIAVEILRDMARIPLGANPHDLPMIGQFEEITGTTIFNKMDFVQGARFMFGLEVLEKEGVMLHLEEEPKASGDQKPKEFGGEPYDEVQQRKESMNAKERHPEEFKIIQSVQAEGIAAIRKIIEQKGALPKEVLSGVTPNNVEIMTGRDKDPHKSFTLRFEVSVVLPGCPEKEKFSIGVQTMAFYNMAPQKHDFAMAALELGNIHLEAAKQQKKKEGGKDGTLN